VVNNGTSTAYFKIHRSVRQGDPIAAYLFTPAIELLAINIRKNENIEGIKVNKSNIKLSLYADDMTGLLVGVKSIIEIMKLIGEFKTYSGLGVNAGKTELMPIGIAKNTDKISKLGYKIVSDMKVTGVVFSYDKNVLINKNFSETLLNLKKMLNIWKQRNLSPIGKVQVIKTFGVSKLLFIANMTNTPPEIIKEANSLLFSLEWSK